MFEAMSAGWQAQQHSRYLRPATIEDALRLVRRFARLTNEYPWRWTPIDVEDWTSELVSEPQPIAYSTLRAYQQTLARFLDYLVDRR